METLGKFDFLGCWDATRNNVKRLSPGLGGFKSSFVRCWLMSTKCHVLAKKKMKRTYYIIKSLMF